MDPLLELLKGPPWVSFGHTAWNQKMRQVVILAVIISPEVSDAYDTMKVLYTGMCVLMAFQMLWSLEISIAIADVADQLL